MGNNEFYVVINHLFYNLEGLFIFKKNSLTFHETGNRRWACQFINLRKIQV